MMASNHKLTRLFIPLSTLIFTVIFVVAASYSGNILSLFGVDSIYTLTLSSSNGNVTSLYDSYGAVNALTTENNAVSIEYDYAKASSACALSLSTYGYYGNANDNQITNIQSVSVTFASNSSHITSSKKLNLYLGDNYGDTDAVLTLDGVTQRNAYQTLSFSVNSGDFSSGYSYFQIYDYDFGTALIQSVEITYTCKTAANDSVSDDSSSADPYEGIDTNEERETFETSSSYVIANSFEDAQLRTAHGLISGTNMSSEIYSTTNVSSNYMSGGYYKRNTAAQYTFQDDNSYESYTILNPDGTTFETIYYGGAYTSLNEVAAYLLAFEEVPPNMGYTKNDTSSSCTSSQNWWRAGRVNYGSFSGPQQSKYTYEPAFPGMALYSENYGVATRYYVECDFGDWENYNSEDYVYGQGIYSSGGSINRGVLRFVFTAKYQATTSTNSEGKDVSTIENTLNSSFNGAENINNRYVFYTYDHYGDFQEYLNYADGWGQRFGSMTAGNYTPTGTDYPPTEYQSTTPWSII
ncbi:MAG: hypothetical protein WC366_01035 [Bacilli bacterium]|jgi:hypothetical protein